MVHQTLQAQMPLITQLSKQHKVKNAYAFGSVVSNKFNDDSDIDMLINFEDDIEPLQKGEMWWNLHDTLRNLLKREVDILIESSLKNPYLIADINEKKQLIYAA